MLKQEEYLPPKQIIQVNEEYTVIDALYLTEIIDNFHLLSEDNFENDIRNLVFPFNDYPFATFNSTKEIFELSQIKKIDYKEAENFKSSCFSTDTGLLLIIRKEVFFQFCKMQDYNFDALVDSEDYIINLDFWNNITKTFKKTDILLFIAESSDSNYDFKGSGIYMVSI